MSKPSNSTLTASAVFFTFSIVFNPAIAALDDDLSLEDLTRAEISSVSRRSQSLSNVPAAAFIISADDIRRSGALALPDVLRMVPGIQVARIDSGRYAVSARGFNGRFANKLQVLIDGRSIYDPFFSGTIWEHDPIPLEDIERIEVIRGAGAAMWGVNAVNGVINIISRHSRTQTGGMLASTLGTNGQGQVYARAGASLDADTSWKISIQGRHAEPSKQAANDERSEDRLNNSVVDFRFDKALAAGSDLSIWANAGHSSLGDLYPLTPNLLNPAVLLPITVAQKTSTQTLGARYRWLTDRGVESSLQASLGNASAGLENAFEESHTRFDIDYQGRFTIADHDLLWGASHRTVSDEVWSRYVVDIAKGEFTQHTSGIFLHDNWTLIPERLQLGFGARWDYTNLGGGTVSPNATLMWTPTRTDTLWAKYSRAPRMPARAEYDVSIYTGYQPPNLALPFPFNLPVVFRAQPGSKKLHQETMEGVELGYRSQLAQQFGIDLSVYRYRYSDIVSSTLGSQSVLVYNPFVMLAVQNLDRCNCGNGWLNGAELSVDSIISTAWRLQLSYTWTQVDMDASSNPIANAQGRNTERATPRHAVSLRSQWNLSSRQQFDAWIRGSSGSYRTLSPYTTETRVPGYMTLDLRYAHKLTNDLELAVTGRDLVGPRRVEFVTDYVPATPVVIAPSVLVSARWKF
ncbi:MAG: TonB-dependent receptor [Azonexus sp.]|jgi:iron complex outermembrane recepter protein|nr:TonB-dependent receptor [Azonexus sp.]